MLFDDAFDENSVSTEFDSTEFFAEDGAIVMIHRYEGAIVSRTRLNRKGRLKFIWLMFKFHFIARTSKEK